MRNTRALIAGLGTTGMLVAASACVFLVASAVIAFKGWPGAGLSNPVGNLFVDDSPPVKWDVPGSTVVAASTGAAARVVAATPAGPAFVPVLAGGGARAVVLNRAGVPIVVKIPSGGQGGPNAGVRPPGPGGTGGLVGIPGVPGLGGGGVNVPGIVRGTTGTVGSTVSGLGDQVGGVVGQVNPQLGGTVSQTGHGLGDTVTQTGNSVAGLTGTLTGQHQ